METQNWIQAGIYYCRPTRQDWWNAFFLGVLICLAPWVPVACEPLAFAPLLRCLRYRRTV